MSNPATVWAALSSPASPVGSIPFVYSDGLTIQTQVANLWYNQAVPGLSVGCGGDQTGSDTFNGYLNFDSYWAYSSLVTTPLGAAGVTAGFTVSSSRGTGTFPLVSQSGDFIGMFSGWAYSGAIPTYQELAGSNIYAVGGQGAGVGIGGEIRWLTKQDGSLLPTEWWKLTNLGNFQPVTDNLVKVGFPSFGLAGIFLSYTNSIATGSQTINKPAGKVLFAAGASSLVVTNSLVSVGTIVQAQLETVDATAFYVKAVTPAAGSFTITLNANCAAQVAVNFVVFRTDT